MKKLIIVLSVFLAVGSAAFAQETEKPKETEAQKTMYCCPMHPKKVMDHAGKCSKCGMDMVKTTEMEHDAAVKGSQSKKESKMKYVCTMDGSTSDKPGKCPKCGMDMTKKEKKKKETMNE